MKLLFQKILSLAEDKATCSMLIFEEKYKVMLDCGLSPDFDLTKYRAMADQLKDVKIVLISHSGLEYSGAYPFLIS
jgi:Cft2 family RNA processing exonuclease